MFGMRTLKVVEKEAKHAVNSKPGHSTDKYADCLFGKEVLSKATVSHDTFF